MTVFTYYALGVHRYEFRALNHQHFNVPGYARQCDGSKGKANREANAYYRLEFSLHLRLGLFLQQVLANEVGRA